MTTLRMIQLSLIGLLCFALTACGRSGGGVATDAKKAAELRCKMVVLQNKAKNASGVEILTLEKEARAQMKKMNEIRKKYFKAKGKQLRAFEALFDKFKAKCGG